MDAAVHAETLCLPALRRAGFGGSAAQAAAFACMAVDLFASDMLGHYQPWFGPLAARLPIAPCVELLHFGSRFDTPAIADCFALIEARARSALGRGPAGWRLAALGATLHAVHDFYSHSNWCQIDWAALGFRHPTWDEVPADLRAGLDLHTAAGHGVRPPAGRFTHDQLNADHAGRPGHAVALTCAQRATRQWLGRARVWCGESWPAMQCHTEPVAREYLGVAQLARAVGHWNGPEPLRADLAVAGLANVAARWRGRPIRYWTEQRLGLYLSSGG